VTVEVPPVCIAVGQKAFVMVTPDKTVRIAVLLAGPVGASAVLTPEVAFGFGPALVLVTSKVTVQLLFAGIVIPTKVFTPEPADNRLDEAPAQVPSAPPPTALRWG
jgi:hypothetical protein